MTNKLSGVALATAAAALFSTGIMIAPAAMAADAGTVQCAGINSCKGHSDCKTATSECKGLNSCKGQGWVGKSSEKECLDAGGKVTM